MWKDRVIAITGAASGIGQALALQFGKEGAHLAISDIDEAGLETTAQEVHGLGVNVMLSKSTFQSLVRLKPGALRWSRPLDKWMALSTMLV